ncbi:MAG: HAMP domain-containing sensor histidine kinase [Fuerstiella sp.]
MILITTSFWIYAARTRTLVENQQVLKAEALVPGILRRHHHKKFGEILFPVKPADAVAESIPETDAQKSAEVASPGSQTSNANIDVDIAVDSAAASPPKTAAANGGTMRAPMEWTPFIDRLNAVDAFRIDATFGIVLPNDTPSDESVFKTLLAFKNGKQTDHVFSDDANGIRQLTYYKALRPDASCAACHNGKNAATFPSKSSDDPDAVEPLAGMVTVTLPMDKIEAELSRNRAVLLASAIVTSFLAMLVAYVIVRYIIVKPVLHLKDVSDEIARGNLNLRADIKTGDEFEELSHAFNRMLRHMTTVNEELRGVNDNLDAKVDQLAQANMELFNTNAMKDEFLATMSHELRTPLNSILGFSDVLAKAPNLDTRQQRYVDNIRTSGRNLMVQINDLLDLAKIESGQMTIQAAPAKIGDVIESQIAQIMPLADQKNIDLRIQPPDNPLPSVHQDVGKIRQILTNLLSNAIKFTPEGGRVRISSRMVGTEQFEICVEDTGIGIPMHEQDRIFEKFRQGTTIEGERDQMKREYGGTGLGLSIVRELARLLGGDVQLESEFGKGSMFTVKLPVEAPPEKPTIDLSLDSTSSTSLNRITSVDLLNPPQK